MPNPTALYPGAGARSSTAISHTGARAVRAAPATSVSTAATARFSQLLEPLMPGSTEAERVAEGHGFLVCAQDGCLRLPVDMELRSCRLLTRFSADIWALLMRQAGGDLDTLVLPDAMGELPTLGMAQEMRQVAPIRRLEISFGQYDTLSRTLRKDLQEIDLSRLDTRDCPLVVFVRQPAHEVPGRLRVKVGRNTEVHCDSALKGRIDVMTLDRSDPGSWPAPPVQPPMVRTFSRPPALLVMIDERDLYATSDEDTPKGCVQGVSDSDSDGDLANLENLPPLARVPSAMAPSLAPGAVKPGTKSLAEVAAEEDSAWDEAQLALAIAASLAPQASQASQALHVDGDQPS